MALPESGKGQHPQTLVKLIGQLELSPTRGAPHELEVNAVRLGIGVAHPDETHDSIRF
jgi:hypothetical protein